MLSFSAVVKVLRDCDEQRVINGFYFNVFEVQASNVSILAFFDARYEVKEGDYIESNNVYLTNYELVKNPKSLALRFGKFNVIDESQAVMPKILEVVVNGKVVKSEKAKVKYIGVTQYPYIAVTLSIRNEINKTFDVLLTASHKRALAVSEMGPDTYISCKAKLYRENENDIYKLTLVDYTDCSPNRTN